MRKFELFDLFANQVSQLWISSLISGIGFIVFGILILLFPQILVAMIAAFFLVTGATCIGFAWKGRRFRREYYDTIRFKIDDIL